MSPLSRLSDAVQQPRAGLLLLRWTLALLMLPHGIAKAIKGVGGIEQMLTGASLPGFIAYGVYLGELIAPLMLLAGFLVVPAALVIAINMLMAVLLVHSGHFANLTPNGGWALELQAFFLVTAIVVAMTAHVASGKKTPELA
ncbi:MAG: DoxX family protein [Polaromonas sp.]|nr:DoxX family protein [Polaromonas sp.]